MAEKDRMRQRKGRGWRGCRGEVKRKVHGERMQVNVKSTPQSPWFPTWGRAQQLAPHNCPKGSWTEERIRVRQVSDQVGKGEGCWGFPGRGSRNDEQRGNAPCKSLFPLISLAKTIEGWGNS